jgi:hypothetical protein
MKHKATHSFVGETNLPSSKYELLMRMGDIKFSNYKRTGVLSKTYVKVIDTPDPGYKLTMTPRLSLAMYYNINKMGYSAEEFLYN